MPAQLHPPPKGSSRFDVLFCNPTGTKKQRRWVEGKLTVGFNTALLYDTENDKCVMCLKGTGLHPNTVYQKMERARCGADWYAPGTELTVGCFSVQIEQVMELHLIPLPECTSETTSGHTTVATCVPVGVKRSCSQASAGCTADGGAAEGDCKRERMEQMTYTSTGAGEQTLDVPLPRSHDNIREALKQCFPDRFE